MSRTTPLSCGGVAPRHLRGRLTLAAIVVAGGIGIATPGASAADAGLSVTNIAAPNIVGDSNVAAQAGQGPDSFLISGRYCNTATTHAIENLQVFIGDGVTPGTFPAGTIPVGAPYSGTFALALDAGEQATRFIGHLDPGECQTEHWLVTYTVVDGANEPLFGVTNDFTDDFSYPWTLWGVGTDAGDASAVTGSFDAFATVRSEISAAANKIAPAGAFTVVTDDTSPVVGETVELQFNGVSFGKVGAGFDQDGDGNPDYDLWFQPIGEASAWNSDVFRIVRVESSVVGTNCGGGNPDVTITQTDTTYLSGLDAYGNCNWDGTYTYVLMALAPGSTQVAPYQEVASGNDNEKYNADYCGDSGQTADICIFASTDPLGGTPLLDEAAAPGFVAEGGTVTWDLTWSNPTTSTIGDASSHIWIDAPIPPDTTYAAGSASCDVPCTIYFSTDGVIFTTTEPVDPTTVTDIRYDLTDPLAPGTSGVVSFDSVGDPGFNGTATSTGIIRMENGPQIDDATASACFGCSVIGDLVWDDVNGNGALDGGEVGLDGVTVDLYQDTDSNGSYETLLATTVTAGGGAYAFTGLGPGVYRIDVDASTAPAGYVATTPDTVDRIIEGDFDYSDVDFGLVEGGTIGDRVWDDQNADDVQDPGEPGLNGVTVELYRDADGDGSYETLIGTQVTAGDGTYQFTDLIPGLYRIDVDESTAPPGYIFTTSDPQDQTLAAGQTIDVADFGMVSAASIGNWWWLLPFGGGLAYWWHSRRRAAVALVPAEVRRDC